MMSTFQVELGKIRHDGMAELNITWRAVIHLMLCIFLSEIKIKIANKAETGLTNYNAGFGLFGDSNELKIIKYMNILLYIDGY